MQWCMVVKGAAGGEQSAMAFAERPGGQVRTLQGTTPELQRQLDQQCS